MSGVQLVNLMLTLCQVFNLVNLMLTRLSGVQFR
jgi:hypothetical protein